ncbi:MAG TPA: PQQ-binding-like beta-propeller repeat protein [Polyangiales bacterium]|nr:PQQ-binding-like beta-propeller repeat protein [Polyangiales bacterium]
MSPARSAPNGPAADTSKGATPGASPSQGSAGNAAGPGTTAAGSGATASGGALTAGTSSAAPGATHPMGAASQWTMIAYDEAGTHNNTAETVLTRDNAASLSMLWQVDMGTNVYGAPLMVGDKIYASGGSVRAFDAESGMQLWMATVRSTGSMAYDDGVLYVYTSTPDMVALDAATGMQLWKAVPKNNPGGDGLASPIVAGDMVYIGGSHGSDEIAGGSFRGYLAAFQKKTGDNVWTQFIAPEGGSGACLWNSVAVDRSANRIYLATANDHHEPASDISDAFVGMALDNHEILWKNQRTMGDTWNAGAIGAGGPPDADFAASPVLYETMVNGVMTKVISSGQKHGAAHAVRADDGMLLWTRQVCTGPNTFDGQMGIFTNGAWSGKLMLYACNDGAGKGTMFGFDGATGDMVWTTPLNGSVWGRMSVANGVGFVGAGTELLVFDTDTGKIIKTVASMGGTVAGTPTIANGRVGFGEGLSWASGVAGRTLTILKVK